MAFRQCFLIFFQFLKIFYTPEVTKIFLPQKFYKIWLFSVSPHHQIFFEKLVKILNKNVSNTNQKA